jgi:hypothetical protein
VFDPRLLIISGWFIWGGHNFTRTARNISLEHTEFGPKLCAELEMNNGGTRGLQGIMLSEKITNNDGHLKFLVSLSSSCMDSVKSRWILMSDIGSLTDWHGDAKWT